MPQLPDIYELADKLNAARGRYDADEQRIGLALIRELAHGAPVSLSRLATKVNLPDAQVARALERVPGVFRDDERRVVGFMGLSILEMGQHRIHIDGRTLSAWCAWDTLFLPELIGARARVTSRAPGGNEEISLTVTPDGPADVRPQETVVSFLLPPSEFDATVIQSFCHFVHFFASPEAAVAWIAEHPGTFTLSLDDAYQLAQLTNQATFGAALATAGAR